MKKSDIFTLILCFFVLATGTVAASDLTSASFIIRNPIIGTGAGYGTSSSFKLISAGNTLLSGIGSSATYIGHSGFLYYPFVTAGTLVATPNGAQVDLTWPASTAGLGFSVSGYNTGEATVSGGPYTYTSVGNVTSYSYTSLTPGQYCFVLQTLDAFSNVIATSNEACATVQPTIAFAVSANAVQFGTLSSGGPRYATTSGGSASDTTAHTMTASSNAPSGYTISYNGPTLTSGANTIAVASSVSGNGSAGTPQFGLSLGTTGSATIPVAYRQSGPTRTFVANTATTIATTAALSAAETFDLHYLANISSGTPAGQYSTNITYIITGNF